MATFWERVAHSVNHMYVLFVLSICIFGCFPFRIQEQESGSDCASSLSFYFLSQSAYT